MKDGFYWTKIFSGTSDPRWIPSEFIGGKWTGHVGTLTEREFAVGERIGEYPSRPYPEILTSTADMLALVPPDIFQSLETPAEGSWIRVLMSGEGMIDSSGEAESFAVQYMEGAYWYTVGGIRRGFAEENDAIAALGKELRKKNRGKWNSAKDAGSYAGDASPVVCPQCGFAPCIRKCGKAIGGSPSASEDSFVVKATSAGFTWEQVEFIRELIREVKDGL